MPVAQDTIDQLRHGIYQPKVNRFLPSSTSSMEANYERLLSHYKKEVACWRELAENLAEDMHRSEDAPQKREHTKVLFLGGGKVSERQALRLRKRLTLALELLGGLQQSHYYLDDAASEKALEQERLTDEALRKNIEVIARDLFCALTGEEVIIQKA